MGTRIPMQVFANNLSQSANLKGKSAETFLKALVETILEDLNRDGMVGVPYLGIFRLTDVADRESVDVRNGNRILIPGGKKLSFVADEFYDTALAELMSEPMDENADEPMAEPSPLKEFVDNTIKEKNLNEGMKNDESVSSDSESDKQSKKSHSLIVSLSILLFILIAGTLIFLLMGI